MSFIIAAPSSGCGKTTITLGLLRALYRRGVPVRGAKSGPDYIDPQFHAAACKAPCVNLDAWAMTPDQIRALAAGAGSLIVEGAMGLFDGAPPDGRGATADLAKILNLPVVLVIDASSMGHSVAPLVQGFAAHDPDVSVAGVILNRVGSERHERMLRAALKNSGTEVFGAIYRSETLSRPSRHLGLVQAGEMPDLEDFLDAAANNVEQAIGIDRLMRLSGPPTAVAGHPAPTAEQTIAIACDAAFSFLYPHHIAAWDASGASIKRFSPLNDDPVPDADFVFLPGGYPELYAGQLAANRTFLDSLRAKAASTPIYGECGGYMALGEVLTDAEGRDHEMAGLLPLHSSFAERKLHLGYRTLTDRANGSSHKAHEFHYAMTVRADGPTLFDAIDAEGRELPPMGLRQGNVSGSFAHIISDLPIPSHQRN